MNSDATQSINAGREASAKSRLRSSEDIGYLKRLKLLPHVVVGFILRPGLVAREQHLLTSAYSRTRDQCANAKKTGASREVESTDPTHVEDSNSPLAVRLAQRRQAPIAASATSS